MTKDGEPQPGVESRLAQPGSITYMQIPASDVPASAEFYTHVFGWKVRSDPNHASFDDANGHLSGAIVGNRTSAGDVGVLPYIYVSGIDRVLERIVESGGEIVRPRYDEGGLWVATFRDPGGNVIGVWEMAHD